LHVSVDALEMGLDISLHFGQLSNEAARLHKIITSNGGENEILRPMGFSITFYQRVELHISPREPVDHFIVFWTLDHLLYWGQFHPSVSCAVTITTLGAMSRGAQNALSDICH
jgi:hypothetical protein